MKTRIVLGLLWLLLFLTVCKTSTVLQFTNEVQSVGFANMVLLSCKISFFSCLWVFVLTEQSMIFSWIRTSLFSLVDWYAWEGNKTNHEKRTNAEYLLKPFLTCEKCTTGNLAFWAYVWQFSKNIVILDLLFTVSLSIFFTIIFSKTWQK